MPDIRYFHCTNCGETIGLQHEEYSEFGSGCRDDTWFGNYGGDVDGEIYCVDCYPEAYEAYEYGDEE